MFNKTHLASLKKVSAYLNNKKKQRILELLDKHGTLTVSELVKLTKWQQPEVSKHLNDLANIALIQRIKYDDLRFVGYKNTKVLLHLLNRVNEVHTTIEIEDEFMLQGGSR